MDPLVPEMMDMVDMRAASMRDPTVLQCPWHRALGWGTLQPPLSPWVLQALWLSLCQSLSGAVRRCPSDPPVSRCGGRGRAVGDPLSFNDKCE